MDPFIHLPEYRIAVCKKCHFGCVSEEVVTHLRVRHRDMTPAERRGVSAMIKRIPRIIRNQAELSEIQLPPPTIDPIPLLAPPQTDGLRCRKCPYVVRQVQSIQAHCSEKHGWQNPRNKGRPTDSNSGRNLGAIPELPWVQGVHCQRFFPTRAGSSWFEVGRGNTSQKTAPAVGPSLSMVQPPEPATLTPEVYAHLNDVLLRDQKHLEKENQPRVCSKVLGEDTFAATSVWMDRTQWPAIFHNSRRDILRALTQLPDHRTLAVDYVLGQAPNEEEPDVVSPWQDEQKISCILGALEHVLERCETTARHTSRTLLCWLRSPKLESCGQNPFTLPAERSSRQRYWRLWKRFIAFVIRGYRMPTWIRESETKIRLDGEHSRQLQNIWEHRVWALIDVSGGLWPNKTSHAKSQMPLNSSAGMETDFRLPTENSEAADWSNAQPSSIEDDSGSDEDEFEDFEDQEFEDDQEISDDSGYTSELGEDCLEVHPSPDLTASSESTRATFDGFLELLFQFSLTLSTQPFFDGQPSSTMLMYFSGVLGFSPDSRQFLLARTYCPQLSGLIYLQRLLLLERALPLYPYLTLGIQQRPHTQQLEQLNDIRGKYMVMGSQTPLAELLSLRDSGRAIARTEPPSFLLSWSDNGESVSIGDTFSLTMEAFRQLPDYFITRAEELTAKLMFGLEPDVDLARVKDEMRNLQAGYSFIKHPDNGLDTAYRDLVVRACTSRTKGLSRHGEWSFNAVNLYLKETVALEEMLLGGLYTACGQAPRARDLLSLESENSPSASRGFFIWNGFMVYIVRHHKAKRLTNREFHVVRFLPVRLGITMFKYLVWIRRLANLLRRERVGNSGANQCIQQQQRLVFHSNGNVWPTSRLTAILQTATSKVWPQKLNIQRYRQIAIGVTEKHVREVHSPFNRYDDSSIDADLNVVFAWQSGHRPLQRGITYGLDGAFPHQLQPALLRAYEWASTRWHEFLHQPSKTPKTHPSSIPKPTQDQEGGRKRKASDYVMENGHSADRTPHFSKRREWLDPAKILISSSGMPSAQELPANEGKSASCLTNNQADSINTQHHREERCLRLGDILYILRDYRVLICLICKAAIQPGQGIESHFRHLHKIKGNTLREMMTFCAGWTFEDPQATALPEHGSSAIPELAKYRGFSCKDCPYLTINRKNIGRHCRQLKHAGGKSGEEAWVEVVLQSFMRGRHVRYWIVRD